MPELLKALEEILGLHRHWNVALVGAGKIGSALISYRNFQRRGFEIRAVFDTDPEKVGRRWGSRTILSDDEMEEVRWFPADEALELAAYRGERQTLERAVEHLS